MKPRITAIAIGVDDLERSLRFYRDGLNLSTESIIGTEFEYGAVFFFGLETGLKLALSGIYFGFIVVLQVLLLL